MQRKKETRGGAREGSGRKKIGDAVLYCKMPSSSLAKLKQRAKEQNQAVGTYLVNVLDL